jgi:hypothetical protein
VPCKAFSSWLAFAGWSLADIRSVLKVEGAPQSNLVLCRTPILLEHCADDSLVLGTEWKAFEELILSGLMGRRSSGRNVRAWGIGSMRLRGWMMA